MLIQYIFLRSDIKSLKKGSLVAQACHASVKAVHAYYDIKDVQTYLNSPGMTTIILKIKEDDIQKLRNLFVDLDFVTWREQPENAITCLALRPYNIRDIQSVINEIRSYKLY